MSPDPKTVREIATEHILDDVRRAHDIGAAVLGHYGPDALTKHQYSAYCSAIREAIRTAQITVEWPDGQQPADVVTAEQQQDGAVDLREHVRAWMDGRTDAIDRDDVREIYVVADRASRDLAGAVGELRRVLAERTALAARVAELESEREADTRAVVTLLRFGYVPSEGNWMTDGEVVGALRSRFADRIAALAATETEES